MKLAHIENLVRLETRNAKRGGPGSHRDRDADTGGFAYGWTRTVSVIGEVRGQEAVDLLQAMNTGHDGSFCAGHCQ